MSKTVRDMTGLENLGDTLVEEKPLPRPARGRATGTEGSMSRGFRAYPVTSSLAPRVKSAGFAREPILSEHAGVASTSVVRPGLPRGLPYALMRQYRLSAASTALGPSS